MKAIMIMFDSLNRRMLPPYGCDWVHAPNFQRLAEKTVTFDNAYVGSMPCMPARRELHTGRYNFLHRSWTPLEPFDDSMPEMLKNNGVHSHLISDHYHYWEDGGCSYHTRFNTWEISRGQEGDPWKAVVNPIEIPEKVDDREGPWNRQDWVNRSYMEAEADQPQAKTFTLGLEFLEKNRDADNWFLQLETFDPHEPWYTSQHYKDLYPHDYTGKHLDWPGYGHLDLTEEEKQHAIYQNAALVSMCDHHLGRVLDFMDQHGMWEDTLLIVNTDHGFLLNEHDLWGKCRMPFYQEVAHVPLFIWDPRCGRKDEHSGALVQTIDLAPTVLEFFGVERTPDMEGKPLRDTVAADAPVHDAVIFGIHGGHVNVTDGQYVYMRVQFRPDNEPLFNYTLMPMHMKEPFFLEELKTIELAAPFSFTKGVRTMKMRANPEYNAHSYGDALWDVQADPHQLSPLDDPDVARRLLALMQRLMQANDAPAEQYARLGLPSEPREGSTA